MSIESARAESLDAIRKIIAFQKVVCKYENGPDWPEQHTSTVNVHHLFTENRAIYGII